MKTRGTLSSSGGQRFPVRGRVRNAAALRATSAYGRGITFYTWTSDQYSQYGTKVIPATVRDAPTFSTRYSITRPI